VEIADATYHSTLAPSNERRKKKRRKGKRRKKGEGRGQRKITGTGLVMYYPIIMEIIARLFLAF
jgi:hypothetical protein